MKVLRTAMVALVIVVLGSGTAFTADANAKPGEEDIKKAQEHRVKGDLFDDKGDVERAIKEYKRALDYNPGDTGTLFNLGYVYLKAHQPKDAVASFEKVVSIDIDDHEAYNLLGLAYRASGQKDKAKAAWDKSLSMVPDQAAPKNFLKELAKEN